MSEAINSNLKDGDTKKRTRAIDLPREIGCRFSFPFNTCVSHLAPTDQADINIILVPAYYFLVDGRLEYAEVDGEVSQDSLPMIVAMANGMTLELTKQALLLSRKPPEVATSLRFDEPDLMTKEELVSDNEYIRGALWRRGFLGESVNNFDVSSWLKFLPRYAIKNDKDYVRLNDLVSLLDWASREPNFSEKPAD